MATSITHVKNPLTVIAVFAGLAEVGGTVVLPLLKENTQEIYVWFLMLFPCLLVILFFSVLYVRPHVFYAPSDYRDENIFANLFVSGTAVQRVARLTQEVKILAAEANPDDATDTFPAAGRGTDDSSPGEDSGAEVRVAEDTTAFDRTPIATSSEVFAKVALAEDLVVHKLEKELGLSFKRDVTHSGRDGMTVGAFSADPKNPVVVEVKLLQRSRDLFLAVERGSSSINAFTAALPAAAQSRIQGIIAVVTEGHDDHALQGMQELANDYAKRIAPNIEARVYSLQNLEMELSDYR